jgi:hypothetical protein
MQAIRGGQTRQPRADVGKMTFSYALAGMIAGGLFLIGIRFFPINRKRYSRPSLSFATVLSAMTGLAVGGSVAILTGLLIGSLHTGYMLSYSLGFGGDTPEPYLSIGWILGTALAAIILFFFSDLVKQFVPINVSPPWSLSELR